MIRSRGGALCALLLALCLVACRTPAGPVELVILHVNDIHGYALPEPATWVKKKPRPLVGGLAALEQAVAEERKQAPRSLFLFAGDLLTGQPSSRFIYRGVKGGYLVEGLNLLELDAACVGNHEFDAGLANLAALVERSSFPWLAANMTDRRPQNPIRFGRHRIIERDGLKVAVIGLITPELDRLVDPRAIEQFQVDDPAVTLQPSIDRLRRQADLVVLLTHIGLAGDRRLARELKGVDVIVGGHSHTRLAKPVVENGVIIVQAGCYTRQLGVLSLTVDQGKVTAHRGRLVTLWHDDKAVPGPRMAALLREVRGRVEALMNDRLGSLRSAWTRNRKGESNSGTFLAGCIRRKAQADVGLINSGGIRTELPAGPISRGALLTVLPFSNKLARFSVSGEQLRAICRHNALAAATGDHGVLQLSGLRYRWRRTGAKQVELLELTVGGKPLDPRRTYTCATNEYIAFNQPMKYLGLIPARRELTNLVDAEAVAQEIGRLRVVDARLEGVMQEVRGAPRAK